MKGKEKMVLLWFAGALGSAIVLGAMGAHALKSVLSDSALQSFNTAVRYQFFSAIALVLFLLVDKQFLKNALSIWVYRLQILGMLFFSGSIYLLVSLDSETLKSIIGPITPIGGVLLIIASSWLFIHIAREKVSK
jgi:uncharacterized membrane protein YgdD (TMEM256/DUF423 family)